MQLYVIRHAIAEPKLPEQEDATRELTRDGIRKLRQVVRGLRTLEIEIARILTSPWTRALETAKLLGPISDGRPIVTELLAQAPRAELLAMIAEDPGPTAVVGHEPWLSELVAWLAFGDTRHHDAIQFKKAGVVDLDGTAIPGGMVVRAMYPPRTLRRLAKC